MFDIYQVDRFALPAPEQEVFRISVIPDSLMRFLPANRADN